MQEFKMKRCTVRIHGTPNVDRVKKSTTAFLKKVDEQRRKKASEARQTANCGPKKAYAKIEA